MARVREGLRKEPRADLTAALAAAGDAPVAVVAIPSETQRRALEEAVPELPPQLGGGPIEAFSQGMSWGVATLRARPRPAFDLAFEAKDAASAAVLGKVMAGVRDLLLEQAAAQPELARLREAFAKMAPKVEGTRVTMAGDATAAVEVVAAPIKAAREAARRAQSVSNLKQLALAMHNYHDAQGAFPAAYSTGEDGKPLLSWRVHILPYVEQQELYEKFALDEPWDSPRNRPLIARMPPIVLSPNSSNGGTGKSSYVVPHGPKTMFAGSQGMKLQQITDGTSNTVMITEVNDEAAPIWTKPEDWEVVAEGAPDPKPLQGLFRGGWNVAFADGSVKFLSETTKPELLKKLVTPDGGEVIGQDDLNP
jgi:prepilin-type processing-associated H-X9-DG protein